MTLALTLLSCHSERSEEPSISPFLVRNPLTAISESAFRTRNSSYSLGSQIMMRGHVLYELSGVPAGAMNNVARSAE